MAVVLAGCPDAPPAADLGRDVTRPDLTTGADLAPGDVAVADDIVADAMAPPSGPLMRQLMGLNGHTVLFKPKLYSPTCARVRDYHNLDWDVGQDTSTLPAFPMSANKVNWKTLYGSWRKEGFEVHVSVQMTKIGPKQWKDVSKDARAYGKAFAAYFGPSGAEKLVHSVEVGNEPTNYTDSEYLAVFKAMAKGFREGTRR